MIGVKGTLRKKLDVEFRNCRILRAGNPPFAYKALQAEDRIGTMLPCNVIVQEDGRVEVTAIDPIASMQAVEAIREHGHATMTSRPTYTTSSASGRLPAARGPWRRSTSRTGIRQWSSVAARNRTFRRSVDNHDITEDSHER